MRISEFKYYYRILKEIGIDHVSVLGNYNRLIFNQELYKVAHRKEEVRIIDNSVFGSIADRQTKDNYEYLERHIAFNRVKDQAQSTLAALTLRKYCKRDFNFGRVTLPKVDPTNPESTRTFDLSAAKSQSQYFSPGREYSEMASRSMINREQINSNWMV